MHLIIKIPNKSEPHYLLQKRKKFHLLGTFFLVFLAAFISVIIYSSSDQFFVCFEPLLLRARAAYDIPRDSITNSTKPYPASRGNFFVLCTSLHSRRQFIYRTKLLRRAREGNTRGGSPFRMFPSRTRPRTFNQ